MDARRPSTPTAGAGERGTTSSGPSRYCDSSAPIDGATAASRATAVSGATAVSAARGSRSASRASALARSASANAARARAATPGVPPAWALRRRPARVSAGEASATIAASALSCSRPARRSSSGVGLGGAACVGATASSSGRSCVGAMAWGDDAGGWSRGRAAREGDAAARAAFASRDAATAARAISSSVAAGGVAVATPRRPRI